MKQWWKEWKDKQRTSNSFKQAWRRMTDCHGLSFPWRRSKVTLYPEWAGDYARIVHPREDYTPPAVFQAWNRKMKHKTEQIISPSEWERAREWHLRWSESWSLTLHTFILWPQLFQLIASDFGWWMVVMHQTWRQHSDLLCGKSQDRRTPTTSHSNTLGGWISDVLINRMQIKVLFEPSGWLEWNIKLSLEPKSFNWSSWSSASASAGGIVHFVSGISTQHGAWIAGRL